MRGFFHRSIWSRLPRRMRRAALFAVTGFAATKPDRDARPADPIIVVGCLRSATGLGESARLCYGALSAQGVDVRGIDVSAELKQPLDIPDFVFRDGRAARGPGTLILHVNPPLIPLVFLSLGQRIIREKWIVGYWAWELEVIPPEWKVGIPLVHEVWVPSRFVATAVAARVKDVPIRVLPHAVAHTLAPEVEQIRKASRQFTALVIFNMGSSMERKNPAAAIAAFRMAFGDQPDNRMIVKVMNSSLFPEGARRLRAAVADAQNVTLIDHTLSRSEVSQLYAQASCLVSLHRSEGFGLVIAEAMLHGIPAISTDWSGPTDFVTAKTGLPVAYRLIPARDPQGSYNYPDLLWAEADAMSAANLLQGIREDAQALGERARHDALQRFSAQTYASSVERFLSGIKISRPDPVSNVIDL